LGLICDARSQFGANRRSSVRYGLYELAETAMHACTEDGWHLALISRCPVANGDYTIKIILFVSSS